MNEEKLIKSYKIETKLDLERIIEDYNNYLHKIIRNMNYYKFSAEDIEEIIADAFFIIWKNRERLE